ncbi:MAG: hypothetical protein R3A50_05650 [Saprospiraceae bacterium]|nr:hypothetical protein [Saprospiraceae bacterium]MCB9342342.1 hypothetical protein [Lewinellaceae bacterium]
MRGIFITIFTVLLFSQSTFSQKYADCITAKSICEKKTYTIDKAYGEGKDRTEADLISCFLSSENRGQAEENSTWIQFEIEESGSLTFTITPQKYSDDIDFVVYRLLDGTCKNKKIVRCNAAGDPSSLAGVSPCLGPTGLRDGEKDSSEDAGCNDVNDNAWLAPLQVVKGETYMLLISNVSSAGPGFNISFGGTAMLPCDKRKTKSLPTAKVVEPKPAKKVPVETAPPVAPPSSIGGREVEVGKALSVKTRKIKLKLWDSQVEDGDIISVYLGDKKIIDHHYLRLKPEEFEIELPVGKEFYLTVFADDFGKAEPNTAKVSIFDGVNEQIIDLVAGRKKQESVKITLE